jgi:hypothetical protein
MTTRQIQLQVSFCSDKLYLASMSMSMGIGTDDVDDF